MSKGDVLETSGKAASHGSKLGRCIGSKWQRFSHRAAATDVQLCLQQKPEKKTEACRRGRRPSVQGLAKTRMQAPRALALTHWRARLLINKRRHQAPHFPIAA